MNMVVSAAALSTSTTLAAEPDPTFAAIAAHQRAVAAYNALCVQQDRLEKEIQTDDPRWLNFQRRLESLADAEAETECELANIKPTTIAGVIAILDYAASVEKELGFRETYFDPDEPNQKMGRSWYYFVNRNLAETLRSIAA
jgi:plasmid maintenance system antidote protein VapI